MRQSGRPEFVALPLHGQIGAQELHQGEVRKAHECAAADRAAGDRARILQLHDDLRGRLPPFGDARKLRLAEPRGRAAAHHHHARMNLALAFQQDLGTAALVDQDGDKRLYRMGLGAE